MSDPLNDALLALNPYIPHARAHNDWARYSELVASVGYTSAKTFPEVRRLLQALGTEVGRNMIDENVWVSIARSRIQALMDEGKSVAITGIRFPNEFQMIRYMGGQTVWVERPSEEAPTTATGQHASETSVTGADFDTTLVNDGTLEQLYSQVDRQLLAS